MRSAYDRVVRFDDENPHFVDAMCRRAGYDCMAQWLPECLDALAVAGIDRSAIEITERLRPIYSIRIWSRGRLQFEWAIRVPGAGPEAVSFSYGDEIGFQDWFECARKSIEAESHINARWVRHDDGSVDILIDDKRVSTWRPSPIKATKPIHNRLGCFYIRADEVNNQTEFALAVLANTHIVSCRYVAELHAYEYVGFNPQFAHALDIQQPPEYVAAWNDEAAEFDVQPILWQPGNALKDLVSQFENVIAMPDRARRSSTWPGPELGAMPDGAA